MQPLVSRERVLSPGKTSVSRKECPNFSRQPHQENRNAVGVKGKGERQERGVKERKGTTKRKEKEERKNRKETKEANRNHLFKKKECEKKKEKRKSKERYATSQAQTNRDTEWKNTWRHKSRCTVTHFRTLDTDAGGHGHSK